MRGNMNPIFPGIVLLLCFLCCHAAVVLPSQPLSPPYIVTNPTPAIPKSYPLFKQCDKRWGQDLIVTETVCQVGCLMSSISMALNGFDITIESNSSNPGTFNAWLRTHQGYTKDNDLIEANVTALAPSRIKWLGPILSHEGLTTDQIRNYIEKETVLIANVMNGRHFVLVVGYDTDNSTLFYVNDPGFDIGVYSYNDMVGYRLV